MEIRKTIKVSLSATDVKKAIAKYVKTELGYNVSEKDVFFRLGKHLKGYGLDEYEDISLDECIVHCPTIQQPTT